MSNPVDLYNNFYDNFSAGVLEKVRAETYGEDVGQSSWMTAEELDRLHGAIVGGVCHFVLSLKEGVSQVVEGVVEVGSVVEEVH